MNCSAVEIFSMLPRFTPVGRHANETTNKYLHRSKEKYLMIPPH